MKYQVQPRSAMLGGFILICCLLAYAAGLPASSSAWKNICPNSSVPYCENVGKSAYNAFGPKVLKDIRLGRIIGVTWRPKGSVIGFAPAIPSAGIPARLRKSPRNAYYYIIDDGSGKPFLRQCREIEVK